MYIVFYETLKLHICIFFAGFPMTIVLGETSFVTTVPTVIDSCPISTLGQTVLTSYGTTQS